MKNVATLREMRLVLIGFLAMPSSRAHAQVEPSGGTPDLSEDLAG